MIIPKGTTHKWSVSGQFAKRCGGNTWAIWQDHEWLWIGDEFKGSMIQFIVEREPSPEEKAVAEMVEVICAAITWPSAEDAKNYCAALYKAGYRKFEIVEDDV
jgi:hypothetical protein